MTDEVRVTVCVALLDEGTAVWRPVEATHIESNHYRLESSNSDEDDERWEFQQGDTVRSSGGRFAHAFINAPLAAERS
jgi:hypothetical protein